MLIIKQTKDYPDYYVTSAGEVWSTRRRQLRVLRQRDLHGYKSVTLYKNKKACSLLAHRLVAEAFIPNEENKKEVNHINGVKSDNRSENLEWSTRSENMLHAFRVGLKKHKTGELHHNSKITDSHTQEIKMHLKRGDVAQKSLAKKYSVSESTISCIKRGRFRK
jgi:hypothetical protein